MGQKDDKSTPLGADASSLLTEKLATIPGITTKKMFGGYGIFHDSKMFRIIDSKGGCFFKADASNQSDYEARGSAKHSRMPYFEFPADVQDDPDQLAVWAQKSMAISK